MTVAYKRFPDGWQLAIRNSMPDPLTDMEIEALRRAFVFEKRARFDGKTRKQKEDIFFRRMYFAQGIDLIDLNYKIHHLPDIDGLINSLCS